MESVSIMVRFKKVLWKESIMVKSVMVRFKSLWKVSIMVRLKSVMKKIKSVMEKIKSVMESTCKFF
jgi:hypothetical protein